MSDKKKDDRRLAEAWRCHCPPPPGAPEHFHEYTESRDGPRLISPECPSAPRSASAPYPTNDVQAHWYEAGRRSASDHRDIKPDNVPCVRCRWPDTNHPITERREGEMVHVMHHIVCPAHEGWIAPRSSKATPVNLVTACYEWLQEHSVERQDGDMLVPTSMAAATLLAAFIELRASGSAKTAERARRATPCASEGEGPGKLGVTDDEALEMLRASEDPAAAHLQQIADLANAAHAQRRRGEVDIAEDALAREARRERAKP